MKKRRKIYTKSLLKQLHQITLEQQKPGNGELRLTRFVLARDFGSLQTAGDLTYHILHAAIIKDIELRVEFQPSIGEKEKKKEKEKRIKNKRSDFLAGYAFNGALWVLQIFPLCWCDPS